MVATRKKILMITLRADFGGGPEHVMKLVSNLCHNYDIYIACPKEYPYYDRYKNLVGESRITTVPHRKFSLKYLFRLSRYIRKNKIDLIHSHGKGAGIYSRPLSLITNRKCIHTFHGLHLDNYNSFQRFIYLLIERFFSLLTGKIISVSQSEFKRLEENGIAGKSKVVIIENGVSIPGSIISDQNYSQHPKQILTITRIDYAKNPGLLINILDYLQKIHSIDGFVLNVIGISSTESKLIINHDRNDLIKHINFIGTIPDIRKFLQSSFCYLSTSRWEGLPLGLMEAMASGVPVIATNVPGNNDLIQHMACGFLYDIEKPGDAANYVKMLSGDFSLWKRLSAASREKILNNYSVEKMADKTGKEYISLLN